MANVGDSRAVIGSVDGDRLKAFHLSNDQTPYRADERTRIWEAHGKICSAAQVFGERGANERSWDDDWDGADPPRVWHTSPQNNNALTGGAAFTRSLGDSLAHTNGGVIAEPELLQRPLTSHDRVLLIASDGVFEFLTSQDCMDLLAQYANPLDGCHAIVDEAFKKWLKADVRTDDISAIVVRLDGIRDVRNSVLFTNKKPDMSAGDAVFAGLADTRPPRRSRYQFGAETLQSEANEL